MMKWIKSVKHEMVALVFVVILLKFSGQIIQFFDPTAGCFGIEPFQNVVYGASVFFSGIFIVWIAIKICFPKLDEFIDEEFEKQFCLLPIKDRVYLVTATFLALLYIFILCCKYGR